MPCLLYCVTQPGPEVKVAAGVCEAATVSREMLGVRLYWSEIGDPEKCLGSAEVLKQSAIQFHQVLREILNATTPIPFRFPTFLENEGVLETHLSSEQELYREALGRVQDSFQYEIIATFSEQQDTDFSKPVSGREYLQRRQQAGARVAAVEEKLKKVTSDSVREWRGRQDRKTHRWFALVPRDHRDRFLAALRTAGGSEGVRLRLSGPWPPSEFIASRAERG